MERTAVTITAIFHATHLFQTLGLFSRVFRFSGETVLVTHDLAAPPALADSIVVVVEMRVTGTREAIVALDFTPIRPIALPTLVPATVLAANEEEAALRVAGPRPGFAWAVITPLVGNLRNSAGSDDQGGRKWWESAAISAIAQAHVGAFTAAQRTVT